VLKITKLSKAIKNEGTEINILQDISFSLNTREILCIMGPSGCGKSTLLGILGGLDSPTRGKVFLDNKDMYELSNADLNTFRNQNIGMVFQNHNLVKELTCYENICLPLIFSKKTNKNDIVKKAEKIINALGLNEKKHRYPYQLSGGEQQRTSVARALIRNPRLLLADEPTGNLDQKNAKNMMEILHNIVKKFDTSVVLVTHDAETAGKCHRTINLLDGRII